MADDTNKPESATPATSPSTVASAKPAARPRPSKAAAPAARKPAAKRAAATAKAAPPASRKTPARPAARTSPAVKKAAPVPFVAETKKSGKPAKAKKAKLVRDSFTMPEPEYAVIAVLKKRCLKAGVAAKKSEILRAAVASLAKLGDAAVLAAVRRLEVIKTGRPAKGSK